MVRHFLTAILALVSLAFVLTLRPVDAETQTAPESAQPNTPAQTISKAEIQKKLEYIQRFSNAFNHIKAHYFKEIDDKTLFENAIRGMLQGLDPHSDYLNAKEYADLHDETQGAFAGLGIEITMIHGFIKVIAPIADAPAQRAGIKAGDIIVRLNGKPVKGMTMSEAVTTMRGPKDSELQVTVARDGETQPLQIKIIRDIVKVTSVKSQLMPDNIGYIQITQFQTPTAQLMVQHLQQLQRKAGGQLSGLILDLRDNPGGLLDSAIRIADKFLDKDTLHVRFKPKQAPLIVYTDGRDHTAHVSAAVTPGDLLAGTPIVILINGGSASASEIVAGALQDYKRAVVLGTRSFGKGSVQTVFALDKKHGLKLTTALYYTPKGRSIQAEGIRPDIIVRPVKIDAPKSDLPSFLQQHESEYDNHIKNGKSDDIKKRDKERVADNEKQALIYKDHMLFEAVNVLKALMLKTA